MFYLTCISNLTLICVGKNNFACTFDNNVEFLLNSLLNIIYKHFYDLFNTFVLI